MSDIRAAREIKKKAETNAEAYRLSSHCRIAVTASSLVAALAAAGYAFAEGDRWDRILSGLVVFVVLVEAVVYGYAHWREDWDKGEEHESLAEEAAKLAEGDSSSSLESLTERQERLGKPTCFPLFIGWAKRRISKRWKGSSSVPIFDSNNDGIHAGTFIFVESKKWGDHGFEGETGTGTYTYEDNVVSINRTNTAGKARLKLLDYFYRDQRQVVLPRDPTQIQRHLNIRFEAKVYGGSHKISLNFKLPDNHPTSSGRTLMTKDVEVTRAEWTTFIITADLSPNEDLVIWFDDAITSGEPSSIQIRNIVIR